MEVLVTDGSYKHTLAIVRSLGKRGINVSVMATEKCPLASTSKYCQAAVISPGYHNEAAFVEFLLSFLQNKRFSLLIPVGYKAVEIISKYKIELDKYTSVELPPIEQVSICLNKKRTYQLAHQLGIPSPVTFYPQDQDEVAEKATGLQYPVVIKAMREAGGNTITYAFHHDEFIAKYQDMCLKHHFSEPELPMVQEYIRGPGYGFFALYQQGICKKVFMHRREREFPVTGGASIAAVSVYDEKLKACGKKLLDALNWHGVAMVEFKLDKADNQFKLMEINPKIWGSLDLAIAAGVDFPYDLARMSRGEPVEYSEEYIRGLRYQWPIEDLICVKSHPSYFWPFFKDLCNFKVKKNITMRDLNPAFHYLFTLLGKMIMGQKSNLAGGGPLNQC